MRSHTKYRNAVLLVYHLVKNKTRRSSIRLKKAIAGNSIHIQANTMKQLSIYHQRLSSTEKYLTVIQIIKELPEDKKAESYQNLTIEILKDNREIISREKI